MSQINKLNLHRNVSFSNYESDRYRFQDGRRLAAYYGFFNAIGVNHGNEYCDFPSVEAHDSYMRITKIDFNKLREVVKEKIILPQIIIENYSKELAGILLGQNRELADKFEFVFREILRNSFEHSQAKEVWLCAQFWKTSRLAQIAILDEGIGIYESLKNNLRLKITDPEHAIKLSVLPGISRNIFRFSDLEKIEDEWQNTGFGLYMITKIAQNIGNMSLFSSGCNLATGKKINSNGVPYRIFPEQAFSGTAINFTVEVDNINKIPALLKKYLVEAGPIHEHLKRSGVPSASTALRMISGQKP
jgi:hypothetical protein